MGIGVAGSGWDPRASRYKCCCGSCHVKDGALIIGVASLVLALLFLGYQFRHIAQSDQGVKPLRLIR